MLILLACSLYAAESNFVNVLYPKNPTHLMEFQFDQNKEGCIIQCVNGRNLEKWKKDHPNIYIYNVEIFNAKDVLHGGDSVFFVIAYRVKELTVELEKK